MSRKSLENRIEKIKRQIVSIGPLRPGTLYRRESVCGKEGCRCKRKKDPVKHGPYDYLSYTFEGKSHTEFVSAKELGKLRKQVANYNRLMKLVKALIDSSIKLARLGKEEGGGLCGKSLSHK